MRGAMLINVLRAFLLLQLFIATASAYDASIATSGAYQELTNSQKETFNYNNYYIFESQSSKSISLIAFKKVSSRFPLPTIAYDRDDHFGDWIRPQKDSCLNTRGIVLKRDSKSGITVNNHCTVVSGDWYDPYTNHDYNNAADIQIDHVVALKNAYMTGAYEWTGKKRCLYANYLGNKFHLLAVNGPENMRKSDKAPNEYVPLNRSYICEYLRNWLEIKYIWNLRMTPREVTAIQVQIKEQQCNSEMFNVSTTEIAQQKQYMEKNKNLCK